MKYEELKNTYKTFIYHQYEIKEDDNNIYIQYHFEIEHLSEFYSHLMIAKKQLCFQAIDTNFVRNMVFHLGMVEAISYFKATCSPQFIIKCGKLDAFQAKWFQKLYYLGLSEFRYRNHIAVAQKDFVTFISEGEDLTQDNIKVQKKLEGMIIPIGGGKDSNVTLDILKHDQANSLAFCIGSKKVSIECAKIAGFEDSQIIEVNRKIDKRLLDLNQKGFLNGHTPFSALLAFLTYMIAYILGKKYVVLSNEDSANETNVKGENINHQYSKTLAFENDFREYVEKYFKGGVEYFSLLRPISEIQIAMLFSKLEQYHSVFKSCNVGSKTEPWKWCCHCPKCLFVFIILSPFLYKEKLVTIFGEDLFEREDLLNTFIELCGYGEIKPFECVGTFSEVRYAVTKTIENIEKGNIQDEKQYNDNQKLPFLLQYYKTHGVFSKEKLLNNYSKQHNIPKPFEDKLLSYLKK